MDITLNDDYKIVRIKTDDYTIPLKKAVTFDYLEEVLNVISLLNISEIKIKNERWDYSTLKEYIEESTDLQKKFFKILLDRGGEVTKKELQDDMNLKNYTMGAVQSGLTRRLNKYDNGEKIWTSTKKGDERIYTLKHDYVVPLNKILNGGEE